MIEDTKIRIEGEEYLNLLLVAKHAKGMIDKLESDPAREYLTKHISKDLKESLKRLK